MQKHVATLSLSVPVQTLAQQLPSLLIAEAVPPESLVRMILTVAHPLPAVTALVAVPPKLVLATFVATIVKCATESVAELTKPV